MKLSQLVKAKVLIGEFLLYMSFEHREEPEHWTHAYRPLAESLVQLSAISFPNSTIAQHMVDIFTVEDML